MREKIVLTLVLIVKFILLIIVSFTEAFDQENKLSLYFLLDILHLGISIVVLKSFRVVDKSIFHFRVVLFSLLAFIFLNQFYDWGCLADVTSYTNSGLYGFSVAVLTCKLEKKGRNRS